MGGIGSGGHNKKSAAAHVVTGTFRRDRHDLAEKPAESVPITAAERRRTLEGLDPAARRVAAALLDQFSDWDSASLVLLRSFARFVVRLELLERAGESEALYRELRASIALYRALDLERLS